MLHSWFLDPSIIDSGTPTSATTNRCSFKIRVRGTVGPPRSPESTTSFLAGEWVKTDQNVTTMEGANEGGSKPPTVCCWRRAIAGRWSRSSSCSRRRGGCRSRPSTGALSGGAPQCARHPRRTMAGPLAAVPGICSAATTVGVAVRVTCPQEPMSRRRSTRSPPRSPRVGVAFPPRTGRIVAPRPPRPVVRPVP